MKKWLVRFAFVCFLVGMLCTGGALAETTSNGLSYLISDGQVTITGYTGTSSVVEIPEEINGYPVTKIGDRAFSGRSSLARVTIPNSVTAIGDDAFIWCNITNVYVPSLEAWCGIDFKNYYSNPAHNGANFYVDEKLVTNLVIPGSVTEIKPYAFRGCSSLTSVTIPDSVTSIGERAFYGCWLIEKVYTPSLEAWCGIDFGGYASSPAYNGADLFINNTLVTELIFPDSMISIGDYTFAGCRSLTSMTIPDGVTSIGTEAFAGCISLTGITIPDNMTSIGDEAFRGCCSVTSITIPDRVTSIGSNAFCYCRNLTSIIVAADNPVYHSSGNCLIETASQTLIIGCSTSAIPTDGSVTSIGDRAFSNNSLTSIHIPDGVTSIGNDAFDGCRGLTSVTLPKSISTIYDDAFFACNRLSTVYYNGTSDDWEEILIKNGNDSLLNAERHYVAFVDLIDEAGATQRIFCEWGQTLSLDDIEALYERHVTLYTDVAHTTVFDTTTAVNENLTLYVVPIMQGDMNGDGEVDIDDAIYLFSYTMNPELYPISSEQDMDYNGDGEVDIDDAIYLFSHTMNPELYPI